MFFLYLSSMSAVTMLQKIIKKPNKQQQQHDVEEEKWKKRGSTVSEGLPLSYNSLRLTEATASRGTLLSGFPVCGLKMDS